MSEQKEKPTDESGELAPGEPESDSGALALDEPTEASQSLPEEVSLYEASHAGCILFVGLLSATLLATLVWGLLEMFGQADRAVPTDGQTATIIFVGLAIIVLSAILILILFGAAFMKRHRTIGSD